MQVKTFLSLKDLYLDLPGADSLDILMVEDSGIEFQPNLNKLNAFEHAGLELES